MSEESERTRHVLAVLSGKGGSGKTTLATCLATIMAEHAEAPVLLVDADFGTAGLTYYLGVNYVENSRIGLSSLLPSIMLSGQPRDIPEYKYVPVDLERLKRAIQPIGEFKNLEFLGAGDPRKLEQLERRGGVGGGVAAIIAALAHTDCHLVIDCRGGIDSDTVALCDVVSDVILVTEPDITAYQATKNVVDVLSDRELSDKLRGFILNKIFQNPQFVRSRGTAEFGCQSLGSIPYDLDATRSFFIGDIPSAHSTLYSQMENVCFSLYPDILPRRPYRAWSDSDFDKVSSIDIDARRGGYVVALLLALSLFAYLLLYQTTHFTGAFRITSLVYFIVVVILGMCGTLSSFRRALGRIVSSYMRAFSR
jgi:flagellar biosynthesis protein FlhG